MIGVLADPADHEVVAEFFELFKTPWEFCSPGANYEVRFCTTEPGAQLGTARLTVIYSSQPLAFHKNNGARLSRPGDGGRFLSFGEATIPIYGDCLTFDAGGDGFPTDRDTGRPAVCFSTSREGAVAHVGYDLLFEVRQLLTVGQPPSNAPMPALELHIELLRRLILGYCDGLMEIPPTPPGYRFIACLTHDVDHPSIRNHRFDHTMFGFVFRAGLQSLIRVFQRKASGRQLARNWSALLKLPLVYLGIAKDFWCEFGRYAEIESGAPSSFYVIPFRNIAGSSAVGPAPNRRAAGYAAKELFPTLQQLKSKGCEIGLHGIDAWCDEEKGRHELKEIERLTGNGEIGVRMHWLYFAEGSPAKLEAAGASYDSTIGYNGTVGFRAGTTQVYKPLAAKQLLELPLHIMDTALFYPAHLNLSEQEALVRIRQIVGQASRYGGVVTVNWHDRSLFPERCWDECYAMVLQELKAAGAWFATATETVAWFRQRRNAGFTEEESRPAGPAAGGGRALPPVQVVHHVGKRRFINTAQGAGQVQRSGEEGK